MTFKQKIWESDIYYDFAERGSLDLDHPGMKVLIEYSQSAKKILDFGCGEGTRLNLLSERGKILYGVDISKKAINRARKRYKNINFFCGDVKSIKVDDFDLIFSAFVLEHTQKTEIILRELIGKLKKGGILLLIAPNYGSPNRASPVADYNRIVKLMVGFFQDILRIFIKEKGLNWRKVNPLANQKYEIDSDTTIEPYLGTLIDFLVRRNMKIIKADSVWERELKDAKKHQKIFRFLGEKGFYPFKFWGPHFLLVAEKL